MQRIASKWKQKLLMILNDRDINKRGIYCCFGYASGICKASSHSEIFRMNSFEIPEFISDVVSALANL